MDMQVAMDYMSQYGAFAVFIVIFLEYINVPIFPSGIIMPAAGICAANGGLDFGTTLLISVLAGLCGSWVLYFVGLWGGPPLLNWFTQRFPKRQPLVNKTLEQIRQKGYLGIFCAKLIPVVRTLISVPAGVVQMNLVGYSFFSTLGIILWNLAFIGAGYLLGETLFQILNF